MIKIDRNKCVEEIKIPEDLRRRLYNRCSNFLPFKKIEGYPKIKYHDYPDRRIYFVEVSKTKRLQEIGYCLTYEDSLVCVYKTKTFFGKFNKKKYLQECKNVETNIPKLLQDIMFYYNNRERIIPTIEVKTEGQK